MNDKSKGHLYLTIVVLAWSTVASAFKITLKYLDYIQLVFYSTLFSTIILLASLTIQRKISLLYRCNLKEFLTSLLSGILNPFLYYLILFKAYTLLQAQEAQTLNFIWPILLVLFSAIILGEKVTLKGWISIILGFIGVAIITTNGKIHNLRFSNLTGVGLALVSACVFSLYWIINLKDERDELVKLSLNFIFSTPISALLTYMYSFLSLGRLNLFLGPLYIGLFEMGITYIAWLKALNLLKGTVRAGSIVYLSRFLSLAIIKFTVGEEIRYSTIIGLLLIVLAALISEENKGDDRNKAN